MSHAHRPPSVHLVAFPRRAGRLFLALLRMSSCEKAHQQMVIPITGMNDLYMSDASKMFFWGGGNRDRNRDRSKSAFLPGGRRKHIDIVDFKPAMSKDRPALFRVFITIFIPYVIGRRSPKMDLFKAIFISVTIGASDLLHF